MSAAKILKVTEDIYNVLDSGIPHKADVVLAAKYAMNIGGEFAKSVTPRSGAREMGKLWASDLGKKCNKQMWYKFNLPSVGESLTGNTKFKFLYGNLLEEACLYLAEEAGHEVTHQQHRVEVMINADWRISGRIDAIMDGVLIDVKSTSSYGFTRYKDGINVANDSFGYIAQLGFYKNWIDVSTIDQGFLWIDKQNGHIKYARCDVDTPQTMMANAERMTRFITAPSADDVPRAFAAVPHNKAGNLALPVGCSYCDFKHECWKDANGGQGLRTFLYSNKPVHLTHVAKTPNVAELHK